MCKKVFFLMSTAMLLCLRCTHLSFCLQIELLYSVHGEGVLIAAHSWGDNVARTFLAWMEERESGWVDKYVAIYFNVAGPTLGAPKALTSLLSGVPHQLKIFFFGIGVSQMQCCLESMSATQT
jgi:hypothetical protein